jgi:hypothetical protein
MEAMGSCRLSPGSPFMTPDPPAGRSRRSAGFLFERIEEGKGLR